jgi:hypothetical protein
MAGTLLASPPAEAPLVSPFVDETAARRTLREQIARLEGQLGHALTAAYPALPVPARRPSPPGPRLLSLGELERIRDMLAGQVGDAREAAAVQAERQEAAREQLEAMLLAPGRHRFVRISSEAIGEPSCKTWESRPRLGLLGMLMGWWCVKISSGCPLPRAC